MRLVHGATGVVTIVLTLTLALGCGPVEAEGSRRDFAVDARLAFLDAFQSACADRDVDAAVELVHLEGAQNPSRSAARYRDKLAELFAMKIESLSIGPPDESLSQGYVRGATRYRANLDIVATLVVELDPHVTNGMATSTFPLGRVDGEIRIATAVPVP